MEATQSKYALKVQETNFPIVKITSSNVANDVVRRYYGDDIEIYESFFMVTLDSQNRTTGYVKISHGGIVGTVVDVRLICKYAIEVLATGVIICHNHPSGTLKPSEADKSITKKIKEALNIFEIRLTDHLIITKNEYFSFADEGIMPY